MPCMRVGKYINEMAQPLCRGEREDVILVWRGRKKWTAIGLGEGRRKLTTSWGMKEIKVLTEEVNEAVPGPKNRSGNRGCQGLTVLV